jgi:hypothetical protein
MNNRQQQRDPQGHSNSLQKKGAFYSYRLFGIPVGSDIPLPELPAIEGREAVIQILQEDPDYCATLDFEICHEWHDGTGRLLCRCLRRDTDYLLSLPSQANFHITIDGTITCMAEHGTSRAALRHLLLNQVIPRYLAHTGDLLLHASAVTLPNGYTVAFVGSSGMGKSTLASYCHLQGAQIIDDDCILLRSAGQRTSIYGGVPTIRLYPDSLRALGYKVDDFASYQHGSDKLQKRQDEGVRPAGQQALLDALFIIGNADTAPGTVQIQAAPGQAAMMSLLGNSFNLDPSDRDTIQRTFQRAAQVLADGLPVYRLSFPRQHSFLPQVLQALLDHPCNRT